MPDPAPRVRKPAIREQSSDESSSGSEEEEIVVERHVPGSRIARKKTARKDPKSDVATRDYVSVEGRHDSIRVVETQGEPEEKETLITTPNEEGGKDGVNSTNDKDTIRELKWNLRQSHDHIRKLQQCVRKLLLDAKAKSQAEQKSQQRKAAGI